GHGHRNLERIDASGDDRVADRDRFGGRRRADNRDDADRADALHRRGRVHLVTRAVPPFITRSTSLSVAMLVSPGVVIARAPCAAPHSTAYCGPLPARSP